MSFGARIARLDDISDGLFKTIKDIANEGKIVRVPSEDEMTDVASRILEGIAMCASDPASENKSQCIKQLFDTKFPIQDFDSEMHIDIIRQSKEGFSEVRNKIVKDVSAKLDGAVNWGVLRKRTLMQKLLKKANTAGKKQQLLEVEDALSDDRIKKWLHTESATTL